MKIIIDADACPVTHLAIEEAKNRNIPVITVCDTSHIINSDYAKCIIVDKGSDSADIAVVNNCGLYDIVITQDYGVACMALGKKAFVLNQNGLEYTSDNIVYLMETRHIASVERRKSNKNHLKGPKKRTAENDKSFLASFIKTIEKALTSQQNG